jgi:hypothetical protein
LERSGTDEQLRVGVVPPLGPDPRVDVVVRRPVTDPQERTRRLRARVEVALEQVVALGWPDITDDGSPPDVGGPT